MKNIKTVKLKATKRDTKVSATKNPAAVRAPKKSAKAAPAMATASNAAATASTSATSAPRREITTELIAARAYVLWEKQGKPHGHDVANWLLAERELKQETQSKSLTARN